MSNSQNVLRHFSKEEAEAYVEESVKLLISHIELKEGECIYVNRDLMKDGKGVFHHDIHIFPVSFDAINRMGEDAYDGSELFEKNGSNLYLYLKGRMLIQTTTTWTVYSGNPFAKRYKITCEYFIKGNK